MAITTTSSIGEWKGRACDLCGHDTGLLVRRSDRKWVHEPGDCPDGPAPEPEPSLIAHDPLSLRRGASVDAIRRLQEAGRNFTLTPMRPGPPENAAWEADTANARPMKPIDEIVARSKGVGSVVVPLTADQEEPLVDSDIALPVQPSKPIGSRQRRGH